MPRPRASGAALSARHGRSMALKMRPCKALIKERESAAGEAQKTAVFQTSLPLKTHFESTY